MNHLDIKYLPNESTRSLATVSGESKLTCDGAPACVYQNDLENKQTNKKKIVRLK